MATLAISSAKVSRKMLQASILLDSFYEFVEYFWDVVVPEEPVWNWHIPYICAEMQKVAERVFAWEPKRHNLIINVPPGSTKSTICSVMFPAWAWTRMPTVRSICGSYSHPLSLELSRKSRDIVQSEKYTELFPVRLREDQNAKGFFVNKDGGYRYATSTGGTVTGYHGHFLIIDDPLNPMEAASEVELKKANVWIRETLSTRKVDKKITPTVLIMQRLHEEDPTADMLAQENVKTRHICLPAEIDDKTAKTVRPRSLRKMYKRDRDPSVLGTTSKLLDPRRLPRTVLREAQDNLLDYGYAGQFLQMPVPPEGGMFKVDRIEVVDAIPACPTKVRFWDKAGTKGGGAYSVGLLMGQDQDNRFYIEDVIRVQVDSGERERLIDQTAALDGVDVIAAVEQEPGSGGKESAENTVRRLAGYMTEIVRPTGDKTTRAVPFSSQVNIGNVYMRRGEWNRTYLNELILFPNSKYKDQVDASSGAFTVLTQTGRVGVW